MKTIRWLLFGLVLFASKTAIAEQSSLLINTRFLGEKLQEAAMHREYAQGIFPIMRWEMPEASVAVVFEPYHAQDVSENLVPHLENVRRTIFRATQFAYLFPKKLSDETPPQVIVTFGSANELISFADILEQSLSILDFKELLEDQRNQGLPVCGTGAVWDEKTWELQFVAIALENTKQLEQCVNSTFMVSMGLVADLKGISYSILGDNADEIKITPFEQVLLRALYSDNLSSGQTPSVEELTDIFDKILR